jgi:hypothetical protein
MTPAPAPPTPWPAWSPPRASTPGRQLGMGLWVTHQLDLDVTLRHAGDGFTVRLRHLPGSSGPPAAAG